MTKFPKTIEACRRFDRGQFDIGDALLDECGPPSERGHNDGSLNSMAVIAGELAELGFEYDVKTLAQYRSVSWAFKESRRLDSISWSIHQVAGSPEMLEDIIEAAGARRLSVVLARALKKQIEDGAISGRKALDALIKHTELADWLESKKIECELGDVEAASLAETALALANKFREIAKKLSPNRGHLKAIGDRDVQSR